MPLHHRDIGFPPEFRKPNERIPLVYSYHARQASRSRDIRILKGITLARFDVIEIEVVEGQTVKMVVRGAYDDQNDICLVISQDGSRWVVRTVWLNDKADLHNTLDHTRYERV